MEAAIYIFLCTKTSPHKALGDSKILHFVGSLVIKTPIFFETL